MTSPWKHWIYHVLLTETAVESIYRSQTDINLGQPKDMLVYSSDTAKTAELIIPEWQESVFSQCWYTSSPPFWHKPNLWKPLFILKEKAPLILTAGRERRWFGLPTKLNNPWE